MNVISIISLVFSMMVALTMRDAATAKFAKLFGDKTPQTKERATFNPLPHFDIVGTFIFPLISVITAIGSPIPIPFLFGWTKPYQFDLRYFKNMPRDFYLTSMAGFFINLVISYIAIIIWIITNYLYHVNILSVDYSVIFKVLTYTNVAYAIFSLLPFPGSIMWIILVNKLSPENAKKLQEKQFIIFIILLGLIIFGVLTPVLKLAILLLTFLSEPVTHILISLFIK